MADFQVIRRGNFLISVGSILLMNTGNICRIFSLVGTKGASISRSSCVTRSLTFRYVVFLNFLIFCVI